MIRKLLVIIILIAVIGGGAYWFLNNKLSESGGGIKVEEVTMIEKSGIKWYQDKNRTFGLAVFKKPYSIFFTEANAQSLREQALLNELSLAVNGSYYIGSFLEAKHAGMLQIDGKVIQPLVFDKEEQVTHVVVHDRDTNITDIIDTKVLNPESYKDKQYILFQTGPLMIANNEIQEDTISKSPNGSGRHLRAVLGFTDEGENFILITRVSYTLSDLAALVLELEPLKGKKINAINLDGGSSTAMYSRDLEQFNFGETKRLPVIIGVE